jgi:hypothetical protein
MLALQDYPVLIAVAALESLLLDNPQDQFLPTPPALLKRCKRFEYDWWAPTAEYLIEGKAWGAPEMGGRLPCPGHQGPPAYSRSAQEVVEG